METIEPRPTQTSDAKSLLQASLAEAQATVRAYDTKAQIVGVGYIFGLRVVGEFDLLLPDIPEIGPDSVLITWAIVILPILLFGYVLYPSRRDAAKVERDGLTPIRGVLYASPTGPRTVSELRANALAGDPIDELCFEILKVSSVRNVKRRRFLRALWAALISFLFLFVAQLLRSSGAI